MNAYQAWVYQLRFVLRLAWDQLGPVLKRMPLLLGPVFVRRANERITHILWFEMPRTRRERIERSKRAFADAEKRGDQ